MASTITLTGDWLSNIGNRMRSIGTGNLGVYATDGIAVSAGQVGLGQIETFEVDSTGGYVFQYIPSTGKVKAFVAAADVGTIDGTLAKLAITGGQTAGPALQITPDSSSGVIGKTTATSVTAAAAITGLTFTGTGAAALAEVTSTTNLTSITFAFTAIGR